MPTSVVAVTGASGTDGTAFGLGTIGLSNAKVYLLGIAAASGTNDPGVPTLSGAPDFSQIATLNNPGAVNSRFTLFQARPTAGSAQSVTATWAATVLRAAWILIEITDGDVVAQSVSASYAAATAASAALAALRSANSDVIAFGMHHVNEGHTPGASLGEVADVTTGEAFAVNAMTGDNITTLNVTWASAARGGIIGVEIPNQRSMVSSSTWNVGVATLMQKMKDMVSSSVWTLDRAVNLQKMKGMVSSSTWLVTIGSHLSHIRFWLPPAAPDTQTAAAVSPDTQTLAAASPDAQAASAVAPDAQTAPSAPLDSQTLTGASPDEYPFD